MARYKIEFVTEVPDDVTDDEVWEWVRSELGENGRLDSKNPLIKKDLEAILPSIEIYREHMFPY